MANNKNPGPCLPLLAVFAALLLLGCAGHPGSTAIVPPPVAPTVTLSAQPQSINSGGSSTLTWSSSNANSVTIDNGIGAVAASGSRSVTPSSTTTYTATASGPGGTAKAMATITVESGLSANLTASPASITLGQSATLTWTTTNASSVSINNSVQASTSGSESVSPVITTTYQLVATGANGVMATASATVAVTNSAGTASPIEHIVVVIMQNQTFDHLFGFFPAPKGQTINGPHAGVPGFTQTDSSGSSVSPFLLTNSSPPALPEGRTNYLRVIDGGKMDKFAFYNGDVSMGYYDSSISGIGTLWAYAQTNALADNYFQPVIGEAPSNQLYLVAAADNNPGQPPFPYSVQPSFGPCQTPDPAARPLTFPHIGDQLSSKGVSWAIFVENYNQALAGNCAGFNPEHDPFQYFVSSNNSPHIQDYANLSTELQNGTLPPVVFVVPNNSHDMHPGNGPVSDGVNFLDRLIKALQQQPLWANTAVVIAFDDGGGWYDHVPPPALVPIDAQGPGFRVPTLLVSPWAKQGYISHVLMDHVSILKFIQWNWGLPSLNPRNAQSNDLSDMLQFGPVTPVH